MNGINEGMSPLLVAQQVQIDVVDKAMDVQQQSADMLMKSMEEVIEAQDPFRGNKIDFSI